MLGAVRKLCGAVVWVWVCMVGVLQRLLLGKKKAQGNPPPTQSWAGEGEGWDSWDSVEPFSVKVVPSSPPTSSSESLPPNGQPQTDQSEEDLFHGMQPVFRKAKKVRLKQMGENPSLNMQKFAVDSIFQPEGAELEAWTEEGGGWEEEMGEEEGECVRGAHEALKVQRREERERRRAQQELLRNQRAVAAPSHTRLGTKVPQS